MILKTVTFQSLHNVSNNRPIIVQILCQWKKYKNKQIEFTKKSRELAKCFSNSSVSDPRRTFPHAV